MARQYSTNNAVLKIAKESDTPGVLPALADRRFFNIPRTQIDAWSAEVLKVMDDSQREQRAEEKGSTVGFNSNPGWTSNMSISLLKLMLPFATYSKGTRSPENTVFRVEGFTGGVDDEITVDALTASQVALLSPGTIISIVGAKNAANNGLFTLDNAVNAGDTEIGFSQNIETESVSVSGSDAEFIYASVAGQRWPSSALAACLWNSTTEELTITYANHGLDSIGLVEGQMIAVGSVDTSGILPAWQNAFQRTVSGQTVAVAGTGIIKEITSGTIVLQEVSADLQYDGNSTGTAIDIMFGGSYGIEKTTSDNFEKPTMFGELEYVDDSGNKFVSLSSGNRLNTMTMSMPVREKCTMQMEWVGHDTVDVANTMRVTRDDSANPVINPTVPNTEELPDNALVNSTANLQRLNLRLKNANQKVSTYYEAGTITLTNNVTGLAVLAHDTIVDAPHGNFGVSLSINAFLEGSDPSQGITDGARNNINMAFDILFANQEGGVGFYCPSMDPGDSKKNFATGQRVTIAVGANGHIDNPLRTPLIVSTFNHPMPNVR